MKKSFTLIELLIVLVVIGVVVTLAIPQYKLIILRAENVEAMNNLKAISDSTERYLFETGEFPNIQPRGVLPPELDVKIPGELDENSTFIYLYRELATILGPPSEYTVTAVRRFAGPDFPVGGTYAYIITYNKKATYYDQVGQYVRNGWYKYYNHMVRISKTSSQGQSGW